MADLEVITAEPPGKGVIEILRETLSQAEKGDISSVAVAVVYRDGNTSSGWSKVPSFSTLIGAIARLQAKLIREVDGE